MKITVIHGQSHKASTYNIAKQLCDKLGGEVTEFFLPTDFDCFLQMKQNVLTMKSFCQ